MDAARLLLFLKITPLGKLYELERIHIPSLHDCSDYGHPHRDRSVGQSHTRNVGDNMDKWKELSVGRKRFWAAVGVIVVIALVGWVTGWWSSPEVPV